MLNLYFSYPSSIVAHEIVKQLIHERETATTRFVRIFTFGMSVVEP